MNFLKGLKGRFKNSILHNSTLVIYSFAIAVILWFIISINIYPEAPQTITNVPITIDINTITAQSNLEIVSQSAEEINVQIQGDRTQVGNLTADDLVAKAIVENVDKPGEYQLKIEVSSNNGVQFSVNSITPAYVNVVFDEYETRTFIVEAKAPNITIEEGLYSEDMVCTPDTIKINGPKTQLDKISKCVAYVDDTANIESSQTFRTSDIQIYNNSDAIMDESMFNIDTKEFTVDVPVYMKKDLKLKYSLRNVPTYFDADSLKFELSVDEITVAGSKDVLEDVEYIDISTIDMSEITYLTKTFTIDINLPQNLIDLSNVKKVTAKLVNENYASKQITINKDKFVLINKPDDMEFDIITNSLTFNILGPKEDVETITEQDIIVQIDLLNSKEQTGSFNAPTSIIVSNYDKVWGSLGDQKVVLEAKKIVQTEVIDE